VRFARQQRRRTSAGRLIRIEASKRKVEFMSGPLEGWKVLDLTQSITGPYVTKLCWDYGADVIKVERPGIGDVSRRIGPFPGDNPHAEKSGMFLTLNTGKRGVTLDLT